VSGADNTAWPGRACDHRWIALSTRLTLLAVVAGTAVRLEQFMTRRSLWLDEALVALNIVHRDAAGLLKPLDGDQAAPVGWLWAERGAAVAFGQNEYALRLVPLAAGIAALVLVALLARRLAGAWAGAVAAGLVATAPGALRFSTEVKPYSSDLAVAAGLLFCGVLVVEAPASRRRWLAWATAGAAGVWLSHPAAIVLGASVVWMALALRRRLRHLVALAAASAFPAGSFAALYATSLSATRANTDLRTYWRPGFPPHPGSLAALGRILARLVGDPGHLGPWWVGAALIAAGCACLGLRALVVLGPLAAAALAADLSWFPLRGRLALYLLPLAVVPLAALARRRAGAVLVAAAAVPALIGGGRLVVHPMKVSEIRPVLAYVRAHGGGVVWVQSTSLPATRYYVRAEGLTIDRVLADRPEQCGGDPDLVDAAAGRRVWLVFGYHTRDSAPDEEHAAVARIEAVAAPLDEVHAHRASAYAVDFSSGPRYPAPLDDLPCLVTGRVAPDPPTGLPGGPFGLGQRY